MDYDLIVVGGGVAGSAAALRAAQYHLRVAWIRGDRFTAKRSRAQWVANIDNMIGIHDGIVRKKIAKRLRDHPEAEALVRTGHHEHISARDIIENTAERIDMHFANFVDCIDEAGTEATKIEGGFQVKTADGAYAAPYVVLATGVMDRQPSIKKEKGEQVIDDPKWIYPFANRETVLYCIRCEGHLTSDTRAAVIGAGDAAAYLCMMLHERYQSGVAVLTNGEAPLWDAKTQRLLDVYEIAVHHARIVDVSGKKGKLHQIKLEDGTEVDVSFALVAMGLFRVYNDLARQLGAELTNPEQLIEERHVQIDHRGESSVHGLFAIGDMARRPDEGVMKQVYTSQEYAVRAVDAIDGRVRAAKRAAALGE